MIDNFSAKIQEVKETLIQFIQNEVQDVTISNCGDLKLRCINPAHEDKDPSMCVSHKIPHIAKCFGCGVSYNIFQINNILHGADLYGRDFIETNLNSLALQYGIEPISLKDLTETQLFKLKTQNINEVASNLLGQINNNKLISHSYAMQIGLNKDTIQEMKIGTVVNTTAFFNTIKASGKWSDSDLEAVGLKPWLFGKNKITYTIFNDYGHPIAFASRNLDYDGILGINKNSKVKSKWINSTISILYDKSECLYGLHIAKKSNETSVYVFEGYKDVCIAMSNGIRNCVCVGGTAFTPLHVKMLSDADFSFTIIALDNDDAGLNATDRILDHGFSNLSRNKPMILLVPPSITQDRTGRIDNDPASYIALYGKHAFKELRPKSAFKYQIDRLPDKLEHADQKTEFMKRFLPRVINETSAITQQEMRRAIATRISVSPDVIRESQLMEEAQYDLINRGLIRKMFKNTTRDIYDALDLAPNKLLDIAASFKEFVDNKLNSKTFIQLGRQEVEEGLDTWWDETRNGTMDGMCWKTGYPLWDKSIGGIHKIGNFTGIAAPANTGKSALIMNLAIGVLRNNDPDDMLLLYWTIDDPRSVVLTKLVSIMTKLPLTILNTYSTLPQVLQRKIQAAYTELKKYITKDKCLSIKDMSIGSSVSDGVRWVEEEKKKYPSKKILLMIDNFANLSSSSRDDLSTQIDNINRLHEMRVKNDMSILSSFEIKKEGASERPGANSVYGSGKIQYRLTLNFSIYNQLDVYRTQNISKDPEFSWVDNNRNQNPIIELSIIKKKLTFIDSTFNQKLYFRFVNNSGVLNEIGTKYMWRLFREQNLQGDHRDGTKWDFIPIPKNVMNGNSILNNNNNNTLLNPIASKVTAAPSEIGDLEIL